MANTIISAKAFGNTVHDIIEGKGVLRKIAEVSNYPTVGAGTEITIPVVPYAGDATEVVNGIANYGDVTYSSIKVLFKQWDKGIMMSDMELLDSVVDGNTTIHATEVAEALAQQQDLQILDAIDKNAPATEVSSLDQKGVLEAEAVLGQRFTDRKVYLLANSKTISLLQAGLVPGNLTTLNNGIADAEFLRFDKVEDGVFYLIQDKVAKLLVAKDITVNVYHESGFHGEKINADGIFAGAITEKGRLVKATVKAEAPEGQKAKIK